MPNKDDFRQCISRSLVQHSTCSPSTRCASSRLLFLHDHIPNAFPRRPELPVSQRCTIRPHPERHPKSYFDRSRMLCYCNCYFMVDFPDSYVFPSLTGCRLVGMYHFLVGSVRMRSLSSRDATEPFRHTLQSILSSRLDSKIHSLRYNLTCFQTAHGRFPRSKQPVVLRTSSL